MSSFTNNQMQANEATERQAAFVNGGSGLFVSRPSSTTRGFSFGGTATPVVTPTPTTRGFEFPGTTTPGVTPTPPPGFSFGTTPTTVATATAVATFTNTRPRSTTIHSFGDNLTPTAAPFGVAEIQAQLPPTNKKIKSQEEYKRDNHFKLDTWNVLFNKLLLVDANLDENIIEYFIAQDHIPDSVLSKLSNYNWGQIFNRYPHTKNIILRGCENHINGDDYSEILCEAFEETNEYCPFELLQDIKKYIWIKKLYEAHPNIFCANAKKEFKLEYTNYLLD